MHWLMRAQYFPLQRARLDLFLFQRPLIKDVLTLAHCLSSYNIYARNHKTNGNKIYACEYISIYSPAFTGNKSNYNHTWISYQYCKNSAHLHNFSSVLKNWKMNENGDKKLTECKSSGYCIASLFVTSCSNMSFFCLFESTCANYPEVTRQWNASEKKPRVLLLSLRQQQKLWTSLPYKRANSSCPMCLSITTKINPRETCCSRDIDCSFPSGVESISGDSDPFLKGKRMQ